MIASETAKFLLLRAYLLREAFDFGKRSSPVPSKDVEDLLDFIQQKLILVFDDSVSVEDFFDLLF